MPGILPSTYHWLTCKIFTNKPMKELSSSPFASGNWDQDMLDDFFKVPTDRHAQLINPKWPVLCLPLIYLVHHFWHLCAQSMRDFSLDPECANLFSSQILCTSCSLCLEDSFSRSWCGWFPLIVQVSYQRSWACPDSSNQSRHHS